MKTLKKIDKDKIIFVCGKLDELRKKKLVECPEHLTVEGQKRYAQLKKENFKIVPKEIFKIMQLLINR